MLDVVSITGHDLSIDDVERIAIGGATAALSAEAVARIEASRALIDGAVEAGTPTYGVNTGFGRFVDVAIEPEQVARLQLNLLRSHACGVGEPFPTEVVRAAMLLRANALATGALGVRVGTVALLVDLLNARVHPCVPSRGSLGASGDLAPLAHLALLLVGEGVAELGGDVWRGRGAEPGRPRGGDARRQGGSGADQRYAVHGRHWSAGAGPARRLVRIADLAAAHSRGGGARFAYAVSPEIQALRPHPGQVASAANVFALLAGSEIRRRTAGCGRVQDAYSLRCSPQVHGASRDAYATCAGRRSRRVNAATDNPLVFADHGRVLSGGNFHGEPVAIALDYLAIALAELPRS